MTSSSKLAPWRFVFLATATASEVPAEQRPQDEAEQDARTHEREGEHHLSSSCLSLAIRADIHVRTATVRNPVIRAPKNAPTRYGEMYMMFLPCSGVPRAGVGPALRPSGLPCYLPRPSMNALSFFSARSAWGPVPELQAFVYVLASVRSVVFSASVSVRFMSVSSGLRTPPLDDLITSRGGGDVNPRHAGRRTSPRNTGQGPGTTRPSTSCRRPGSSAAQPTAPALRTAYPYATLRTCG